MGNFKDLNVWQRAIELTLAIYRVTNTGDFSKDFGLRDQIRRASVSIPSNIAEGDESGTDKQAIKFFYIAKASTAEVQTQLIIANAIGYLSDADFKGLEEECYGISGMLTNLIKARSKR